MNLPPAAAFEALLAHTRGYYAPFAAYYSGRPERISAVSGRGTFWGGSAMKRKLHMPVAADIATVSADLLFGETPTVKLSSDNQKGQARLEAVLRQNGFAGKLNEAAECCAALGDVYAKASWRLDLMDGPIITFVQADCAWPEYTFGVLTGVHFFTEIERRGRSVLRLYEGHAPGVIYMMAYRGTDEKLGDPAPDALEALHFAQAVETGVNRLLAQHIPNMLPNRDLRSRQLGRSDLDGLLPALDALDETYSDWMRDIRVGRARLVVPAEYLRREVVFPDKRHTFTFDEDEEVYTALDIETSRLNGPSITATQFSIRASEHEKTCLNLLQRIILGAGYSPQTMGMRTEGLAESGTALHIRERRSFQTRAKKVGYWKSRLEEFLTGVVRLDAVLRPFGDITALDAVTVEFPDAIVSDMVTVSQSVAKVHDAGAASVETRVRMLHQDWTEKQVRDEAARIIREEGEGA